MTRRCSSDRSMNVAIHALFSGKEVHTLEVKRRTPGSLHRFFAAPCGRGEP